MKSLKYILTAIVLATVSSAVTIYPDKTDSSASDSERDSLHKLNKLFWINTAGASPQDAPKPNDSERDSLQKINRIISIGGLGADLSSPGPIGATTPSTGAFTTVAANDIARAGGSVKIAFDADGHINVMDGDTCRAGYDNANKTWNAGAYRVGSGAQGMWDGVALRLGDVSVLSWGSPYAFDPDTILLRDAPNTLAMRNGTNAQEFRLYDTYTDNANFSRLALRVSEGANGFELSTEKTGTGAPRNLYLSSSYGASLMLGSNIVIGGNVAFLTDNTYDIGASGANRPRNVHVGQNIHVAGVINFGNASWDVPQIKRAGSDVEIAKADGTSNDSGLILSDPNGLRYRLHINEAGEFTVTPL
jgi:hypothetical protein